MSSSSQAPRTIREKMNHWREVCEAVGEPRAKEAMTSAIEEFESVYAEISSMMHEVARANGKMHRAQAWALRWKTAAKENRKSTELLFTAFDVVEEALDEALEIL